MGDPQELFACKQYMRAEDEPDYVIAPFFDAAAAYLVGAGIKKPEFVAEDPLYALAVNSLTLFYYDHRDDVDAGVAPFPIGLRSVINQLKFERGVTV